MTFKASTFDLDSKLTPPEVDLTAGSDVDCALALSQTVTGGHEERQRALSGDGGCGYVLKVSGTETT